MMDLIHAHKSVLERMNAGTGHDKALDLSDPRMGPLLTEGWKLAGAWASAWLDRHVDPSDKDIEGMFVDFSPPSTYPEVYDETIPESYALEGSATRIAADDYVVRVEYERYSVPATATFIVVARGADGHFHPKWSIKPLARKHYRLKDQIGLWAVDGACAYYCGPLVVDKMLPLPPSDQGQPRFAVDAFQSTNGSTLVKQLSVWQWNGTQAENLLIHTYFLYVDDDRSIALSNDLLTVPTKESTTSFSSFGCCAEPRGVWRIRVASGSFKNLGDRFVQPQIQWADRLLAASRRSSADTLKIATPSVVASLRHAELDANVIDKCRVLRSGRLGAFEITFGEGTKLWLGYELRSGQPYFTKIRTE